MDYSKFEISVNLSRYQLFDNASIPAGEALDETATRNNFAVAAQKTMQKWYPGALVEVDYQDSDTAATHIDVSVKDEFEDEVDEDEREELERKVNEELDVNELFDYSDEKLWVYEPKGG